MHSPYYKDTTRFRRQDVGYVFQKSNRIPFLTACENVQIALEVNDCGPADARSKAIALLEYPGIADRAHHFPAMLSGGQQQRVGIARALANKPGVLLADEPTAVLHSVRGRQVMELFRKVAHDHGSGVIVVTHDLRAFNVFDTIYEMEDGIVRPAVYASRVQ